MNTKQALIMSVVNMIIYWLIPVENKHMRITCETKTSHAWIKISGQIFSTQKDATIQILFTCKNDDVEVLFHAYHETMDLGAPIRMVITI
jgi:hypothetical protein